MPKFTLATLVVFGFALAASGQSDAPLRVAGLSPGGLRISVTERWGEIAFDIRNVSNVPRLARVVAFYEGGEDSEFARDLWVPANSSLTAWMSVGPVPKLGPGAYNDGSPPADRFGPCELRTERRSKLIGQIGSQPQCPLAPLAT